MKKATYKLLAVFISLALLLSSSIICSALPESNVLPNGITYEIRETGIFITGYTGEQTQLDIASTYNINGTPSNVIGIAEFAFSENENLTSVEIPYSVKYIEDYAFDESVNLKSITINSKDAIIGKYAFGFYWVKHQPVAVDGLVVKGYSGSTTDTYCSENDLSFELVKPIGDYNSDGVTDIRDLVRIKKVFAGISNTEISLDFNGDGNSNASDLAMFRYYLLRQDTDFNTYEVTFKGKDSEILKAQVVMEGFSACPPDAPAYEGYTFEKWDNDFNSIVGETVVTAVYSEILPCEHHLIFNDAQDATCTEDGNIAYWYCDICKRYFSDSNADNEIELENTMIKAHHTYSEEWSCDNECHWHNAICEHQDEAIDVAEHNYVNHICSVCNHKETFVVTFVDYDDTVLDIQEIAYGNAAIEPQRPEHQNYAFVSWNKSFDNIVEDITVRAQYERRYIVKFIDYDGTVIKSELVSEGKFATAPDNPIRTGYTFTRWDKNFSDIENDTDVTAVYTQNHCSVEFLMPDGTIIDTKENVTYNSSVEQPSYSDIFTECLFDWSTHTYNRFSGWNKSLENICFDNDGDTITYIAQYTTPYEQPVIALETQTLNRDKGEIRATIYLPESCYLYAIDFGFGWENNTSIENYNLKAACPLYNSQGGEKDHQGEATIVINNKITQIDEDYYEPKSFEYTWMCGNGHTVTDPYIEIIVINFELSQPSEITKDVISVFDDCTIFYSDKAYANFDELIKITPVVVVK